MGPVVANPRAHVVDDPPHDPARPPTLAIAAGALLGTGARALVDLALPAGAGGWPWSTFAVNVTGAFVLGAVLGLADRGRAPTWLRGPAFTTGVLGSFTTFSALAVEAVDLGTGAGLAYVAASLAGGLLGAAFGGRAGRGRP